jgi:AcrR family transcriptional regulator
MKHILANLKISISKNLYLTDPNSSILGRNIILNSIEIIDEMGFEKFTFKKLGNTIESPEASIYRYFKNKNQLLTYLNSWYWSYMEYQLVFETTNIDSPEKRLEKAILLITSNSKEYIIDGINLAKIHKILIAESAKSYLTKDVDKINKEGAFQSYKQFVSRISEIIIEINPQYLYPQMLVTTIIEGAHLQSFFAEHLPRLTNKLNTPNYITTFYTKLAFLSLKDNK